MNEENLGIRKKFDFAEQNALMLLRSLKDERKDTENYKVELDQAKESLTGKQVEMEKIKENLNRKMKEIQENTNPGNVIEKLKKLLEINEKKLKETLNSKEHARKEYEKYRKNIENDLDDTKQLYRESCLGKENELNGKERKHYEMLKLEGIKGRNNANARYNLEKEALNEKERKPFEMLKLE